MSFLYAVLLCSVIYYVNSNGSLLIPSISKRKY